MNQRIVRRLPNFFTFMRLILIPVFVFLMINPSIGMVRLALIVFVVAALTDFIDGRIARRYGAVTDFGKLLDPVADKILVMAALVMLVAQGPDDSGKTLLPGWVVVLILARETWVNGLRSVAASKGVVIAASNLGKLKSFLQMVAIILMLLPGFSVEIFKRSFPIPVLGLYLLLVSIVFSYWGAIEYSYLVLSKNEADKEDK